MRIFFANDLHYDARRGRASTEAMARWLVDEADEADVLILGGDYGNDEETIAECLALFEPFPGTRLAIAGNHDVWVDREASSWDRYHRLPELFEQAGFHPLEDEPIRVGDVGFVGALGWYDYSFRVPELGIDEEVYRDKRLPDSAQPVWKDAYYANWEASDPEVADWQLDRLRRQLEHLADAPEIVGALHHVPTERLLRPEILPDFMPRRLFVPHKWLVLNTFLGSQRFAELFAEFARRIDLVVCGHIHLARRAVEHGITFAANGSDYETKELLVYDPPRLYRRTFPA